MLIDGRFVVAAPPERVLSNLFDARLMAECLPGCESLEALADDRYRAVVVVSLAGIRARFDLQVEVTERRPDGIRALTRGEEGGNASSLSAASEVRLDGAVGATHVAYTSDVNVTGRLGRFALGMMKKKAQAMGEEFAANLQRRLTDTSGAACASTDASGPLDADVPHDAPLSAEAPLTADAPVTAGAPMTVEVPNVTDASATADGPNIAGAPTIADAASSGEAPVPTETRS